MTEVLDRREPVPRRYLALAGTLAVLVLYAGFLAPPPEGGIFVEHATAAVVPLHLLMVVLQSVACLLAVRRLAWPIVVIAVPAAAVLLLATTFSSTVYFSLLAVMVVAGWEHPRRAWVAGMIAMLFVLTVPLGFSMLGVVGTASTYYGLDDALSSVLVYAVLTLLVLGAGRWFRQWTAHAADLRALAAERADLGLQAARLGERSRLARDLHDIVAHHVSLIAVRAETAPYTVEDLSPAARVVLADIADDSRKALDELRGVLGVLRRADETSPADRAPQPGGEDVATLVDQARSAGAVTLVGAAALGALDRTTGYVAYRVVQEALTNARRHAPGAPVRVECDVVGGGCRITVSNPAAGSEPVQPGRGLTGMRERVDAVGGRLRVEQRDGDVVVEAVLPA